MTTQLDNPLYGLQLTGNSVACRSAIFKIINEGDDSPGFDTTFKAVPRRWQPGIDKAVRFTPDGIVTISDDERPGIAEVEALETRLNAAVASNLVYGHNYNNHPKVPWTIGYVDERGYDTSKNFESNDDLDQWLIARGF